MHPVGSFAFPLLDTDMPTRPVSTPAALSAARVALWVSCRHASGESHIVTQPWPWMHVLHDRVCEWAPARALSPYESSPALGLSWYVRALIFPEARALVRRDGRMLGHTYLLRASLHSAINSVYTGGGDVYRDMTIYPALD